MLWTLIRWQTTCCHHRVRYLTNIWQILVLIPSLTRKGKFNDCKFSSANWFWTFNLQTEFVGIQGILETGDLSAAPSPQDLALAPISSQDLALAQMYQRDSSLCLQKWGKEKTTLFHVQDTILLGNISKWKPRSRYLCEIAGTSPDNLLMEEAALLAMVRSQEEITALLRCKPKIVQYCM